MLPVASEILSTSAPHSGRKPEVPADSESPTQFADMLDSATALAKSSASPDQGPALKVTNATGGVAESPIKSLEPVIAALLVVDASTANSGTGATQDSPDVSAAPVAGQINVPIALGAPVVPETAGDVITETIKTALQGDDADNPDADALDAAVANTHIAPPAIATPVDTAKPAEEADDSSDTQQAARDDETGNSVSVAVPPDTVKVAEVVATVVAPVAEVVTAPSPPSEPHDARIPAAAITADKVPTDLTIEPAIAKAAGDDTAKKPADIAKTQALPVESDTAATAAKPIDAPKPDTAKPAVPAAPMERPHSTPSQSADSAPADAQSRAPITSPANASSLEGKKPVPDRHILQRQQDGAPAPKAAADQLQPLPLLQIHGPAAPSTIDRAVPGAPAPQAVALPVAGIAVEIASKALDGKNRFEIRLDPPELGRIHVRLDVDRNGEITSHVMTDRQDTLDLLRRDAPTLERALQDAGLKTANNGLQFSLRDHGFGRHDQPMPTHDRARVVVNDESVIETIAPTYRALGSSRAGVDIRV